mgnify:CR=1 FL=1
MLSNQFQESRKGAHVNFELWLEFERWTSDYDVHDEFFNMLITLDDGRKYALNVWTYSFIERARAHDVQNAERLGGLYLNPPDLLVERAERDVCEKVVQHLIATDGLLLEWFVPDEEEPAEEKVSVDLAEESSEPLGQLAHGYWPAQPCVHDVTWRAMWRLNKQEKVERFVRKLSRRLNLPLELLQCERHHSDHGLWNVRLGSPAMEGFPLQIYGAIVQMFSGPRSFGGWQNFGLDFHEDGSWSTQLNVKHPEVMQALEWLSVDVKGKVLGVATDVGSV